MNNNQKNRTKMKKQVLALSLGLISIGTIAQKKELKIAERAFKKKDYTATLAAIKPLEGTIANADDKYKLKYYFLKGSALAEKKDYKKASDNLNTLMKLDKKKRYTSKSSPLLSKMIQEVHNKAVDLYNNKKDYKKASEYFYLTYVLSPKDTVFAYNGAISATQAKDYDTALKYYKELRKIGYTGIEKQYIATDKATGKVETFQNKVLRDVAVKSKTHIKPSVKSSESKTAVIVKNIALILKEQGKTDEAIAALKEARKANPKDLNLILNEAEMYSKLNKMDKFGELMSEAIKLNPNNATLYYNLGVVNFNQGRKEEAKKYYEKAIQLKPDYSDAYMNMASLILDKDNAIVEEINKNLSNFKKYDELIGKQKAVYKEALPFLEKADSLNRNIDTVKTLMNIYEQLEMTSKATEFRNLYKSMR